ncbi:hypothetical protein JPM7_3700 [Metamycoplasma equirhinis]|uniref:restriction endonuclease subunit S n=1 Tax=Metamycoplasma equirhinis TaxID=92402 RepID=UPI0025747704|nr:restriction endonuclease subunit S [Metamycoplasma equirhinis]BDX52763.1 hypothetical protein JPM7_3700 [Metamycoplasma equirhinis]
MKTYKLSQICKIINGKSNMCDSNETGEYTFFDRSLITKRSNKYLFDCEAIIIPGEGTNFIPRYFNGKFDLHQRCYKIESFMSHVNTKYLYYNIYQNKDYFSRVATGSTVPSLRLNHFLDLELYIHNLSEQRHIVNTIGTIDDLIEFNNKIIDKLHAFSDLIYQNCLINTANTTFIMLGNCCEIKTGKLNAEASSINGKYPFFTCGKDELLIDDYAFDCKAIIVAGNGEISCKYYEGKFNAYQRTYVLSPTKYFNLFQKACELGINDLIINSQGSVIKFITKGMLEAISIPLNNETITTNQELASLYDLMFKYKKKNNKLKQIKQNLLSKYF